MLGWQLRHDPNAQLSILRIPSIRQGRRSHGEHSHRRKLSHSTTTSETTADEERRKLLPERRKTLATSTIPKDLFLIAGASSSTSSLVVGDENELAEDEQETEHPTPHHARDYSPSPYRRPAAVVRRQHSVSLAGASATSASISGGIAGTVIVEEVGLPKLMVSFRRSTPCFSSSGDPRRSYQ